MFNEGEYHKLSEQLELLMAERSKVIESADVPPTTEQRAEIDWYNDETVKLRAYLFELGTKT